MFIKLTFQSLKNAEAVKPIQFCTFCHTHMLSYNKYLQHKVIYVHSSGSLQFWVTIQ